MADFTLNDFVLLESHFEMWPEAATSEAPREPFAYPEGDFLELAASTTREGDEFILYLRASLDDQQLPFRLDLLVGARYDVEPESALTTEEVQGTLVWLCYPYLRELVASITSRAPVPQYFLPALTRMPHPSVLDRTDSEDPGPE